MITRKSIRDALRVWKRTDALGQHPLAASCLVEVRRIATGYPNTPLGRGTALRDVLREALNTLRPEGGPPDFGDDRWRSYIILTYQYIEDEPPGYVAGQLGIAQPTYHHAQAEALDRLGAILREQEESAALTPDAAHASLPPVANGASDAEDQMANPSSDAVATGSTRDLPKMRWLMPLAVLGLALLAWLVLRQRVAAPGSVIATIALDQSRPSFISANPTTNRVYAAAEGQAAIDVIDAATNVVLTAIPTQGYHKGIAVNPVANRVYVAQQFAGSVRIIDGANNSVLADLAVPDLIQTIGDLAINPATHRLYVIRTNNNDVAVFDTTTNAFLGAVAFGPPSAPDCPSVACDSASIAVNPATNRVYVTNPVSHRLTVIDGACNTVLTTVRVGQRPYGVAVNPVTNTLYVTNGADDSVSVIDGADHHLIATIAVSKQPVGVTVNRDTDRVYVGHRESQVVTIIDGATNTVLATVPLGVAAALNTLLPATGRVYATTDSAHSIKVIEDRAPAAVAWAAATPTGSLPTPRGDTANRPAGYDPVSNRLVVFGGMKQGGDLLNDTWALANADGTTGVPEWIELATQNTPPPRRSHAGVYDPASNRLITYGGCLGGCTPIDNNVYVLSHANGLGGAPVWTRLDTTGGPPPPRNGHSAVYVAASNRLIVFGGDNCCGQRYNDTWVLTHANGDGGAATWLPLTTQGAPPPGRASHSAVYDPARNRMIVFGGSGSSSPLNDVWVLSAANGVDGVPTWHQLAPTGVLPDGRSGHSAVYDAASGQMLVFGGGTATALQNDVWRLSHANGLGGTPVWTPVTPAGSVPMARTAASAVYRSDSNRLVVFGGDTPTGSLNDIWTLVNAIVSER